jgi:hypothetical protein
MTKYLVKLIIFNTIGKLASLFFRLLVNKNRIFVINYHTTYPEFNSNFLKQIRLNENLSTNELKKEIIESKIILEKNLQTKIDCFCWVIGDKRSYSSKAYNLIKENYKLSFMTLCESFKINSDHHKIHRFNVETNFSLNQVAFILSGIYEFMYNKRRAELNDILSK